MQALSAGCQTSVLDAELCVVARSSTCCFMGVKVSPTTATDLFSTLASVFIFVYILLKLFAYSWVTLDVFSYDDTEESLENIGNWEIQHNDLCNDKLVIWLSEISFFFLWLPSWCCFTMSQSCGVPQRHMALAYSH